MDTAPLTKISVYYLEGYLGMGAASRLQNELLSLFETSGKIVINMGKLEGMDLSIFQILIAAFREASLRNMELCLSGEICTSIQEDTVICGLSRSAPTDAKHLEQLLRTKTATERGKA